MYKKAFLEFLKDENVATVGRSGSLLDETLSPSVKGY